MELEKKSFYLPEVIQSAVSMFQKEIEQKGLSFSLKTDDSLPELVWGDPTRLLQILANLLSNAKKFTNNGSIIFAVKNLSPGTPMR